MNINADGESKTFPVVGATRRMMRGSFANFFGEAVRVLEYILLVPLFLYAWSDVIYGEWLIVSSIVAYLSLANIGMSNFVINRMLQRYAVGDHDGFKRTFWSAWYLYRRIILALLPLFFVFAFLAPFPEWFNFTHISESSIRIAVFLLGLYLLLGHLPGLFSGIYISSGEYARWRILLLIRDILTIVFVSIALILQGGIIIVSSSYLALFLIATGFIYLDIRRRYPNMEFKRAKDCLDKKLLRSFLVPGLFFLLIPLSQFIKIQGSIILAGSIFGGAVVALFGIHRMLANLIPRFISILLPTMQHEITASMERRDIHKVQDTHSIFIKVALAISISAAVFLFAAGQEVLKVWTSGKIEFYPLLWVLLLVDVVIYSVWQTSSVFQIAVNRYQWYAVVRMLSAVVGWTLAVWLMHRWGIVGIVAGFLIPEVLINFTLVPYMTLRIIQGPLQQFFVMIGVGMFLAAVQLLVSGLIGLLAVHPIARIAIAGFTAAAIGSTFTFLLWFNTHERKLFLAVCKVPVDFSRRILRSRSV